MLFNIFDRLENLTDDKGMTRGRGCSQLQCYKGSQIIIDFISNLCYHHAIN